LSQDESDALEQIIAGVDFTGWSILVGEVDAILAAIVEDGSYAALAAVGIETRAAEGAAGVVNDYARAYARDRSAELVGMRYDELGRLVENPNAEWAIDQTTRDFLRSSVGEAIAGGWSNDKLAGAISDSYGFSDDRAMTIARTETQMAANAGALNGYKASGVVERKQWVTAEDDLVEEDCLENAAAGAAGDGVLALDDEYPSGDDAPPAHPNCRCVIVPVVDFGDTTQEE
jgi:SPP1 gp7 family putative phage head morphogenesis protein